MSFRYDDGDYREMFGRDRLRGHGSRYRWVDPTQDNRTKEEWPYGYSDHYLWGCNILGAHAVYSDRLQQWDGEKYRAACDAMKDSGQRFGYWGEEGASKFLSVYYGKPIEAVAVSEGCNVSNGYPYWVFYFIDPAEPKQPPHTEAATQTETSK